MNRISSLFSDFAKAVSKQIAEKPFAVCSIMAFLLMILGLCRETESLFLLLVILICVLVLLNLFGKLRIFLVVMVSLFMAISFLRIGFFKAENESIYNLFHGEYARIEGFVASVPTENRGAKAFFVDSESIIYRGGNYEKEMKLYVRLKTEQPIKYGDKVVFDTILEYSKAYNPYLKNYYFAKGARLVATETELLMYNSESQGMVADIRNYVLNLGDKFFTGDVKALFKALTAGDRSQFSDELTSNLAVSGLSHIVCVSGLHVSIVGMCLYNMLKKKNRYIATGVSFGAVILFCLITGAAPSTVRAAIMFASFLISILVVRENDSFTALSFSAFVLAFLNPYVVFDYGFILSFLSVLGIEIFSYPIKRRLNFLPEFVASSVSVTVSAQLLTLPVCVNMFGYVSVYSVLANLIVSVFFLFALYSCFIFIFISPFWGLNRIVSGICSLFLELIAAVADLFAELPYSILYADKFNDLELVCYYTLILMYVFRRKLSTWFVGICTFISVAGVAVNKFLEYKN